MVKDWVGSFRTVANVPPRITNMVLVVAIAMGAARLLWLAMPLPSAHAPTLAMPHSATSAVAAGTDIFQIILNAHLFGRAADTESVQTNAPETHLKLKLRGIFASTVKRESRALIQRAHGSEKPYALGAVIEKGVTLTRILPDRIIIKRAGRFETLKLDRAPALELQDSSLPRADDLTAIRRELVRQPGKISQFIRMQPVYSGSNLQGWRVYPGVSPKVFRSVGLEPGDLVVAINGIALNSLSAGMQVEKKVAGAKQLMLTVKRHGKTHSLRVKLPK